MLIGAVAFTACDTHIPTPPDPDKDTTGIDKPEPKPESDTLTVADILKMKEDGTLPAKDAGTEKKWVKAYIVGSYNFDAESKFVIGTANAAGTSLLLADDPESTDTYKVASVKLSAGKFRDALNLVAHPENYKKELKLYGIVEAYCGIGGIVKIEEAYLDGKNVGEIEVGEIDYLEGEMSVSDFLASEAVKNLPSGETSEETYTVRGVVTSVKDLSLTNGNATFYISDGQNELYCYRLKGVDGAAFVSGKQLEVGDIVTVNAKLQNYFDSKNSVNILEMVNGNLVRTTNTFDPSQVEGPKKITIAEALAIGNALNSGETTPDQYIFSGEVDELKDISTSFGNLTFYIKDEAGNRFYVYRAMYLDNKKYTESDPVIEIGDMIEITGQITNYNGTIETPQGAAYVSKHTK